MADKQLTPLDLPELSSAPASPGSGFHRFYAKTDGKAYSKSSGGTEYDLTTGVSLTTTGTSGAATLVGTTLNIPVYQSALTNPVTGTGVAGQVSYWDGTGTQTGSNNLFWNNANGRLGIGTNTPAASFHISTDVGNENLWADRYVGGNGAASPAMILRKARGTSIAPSTVLNGDSLGVFGFRGYGATGFSGGSRAGIAALAGQNWTDTAQGALFAMFTTANGTNVATYKMQLFGSGNMVLQNGGTFTDNGQRLQVYGSTLLRGSGTTSATTALLVQNSTPTANFTIRDDGGFAFRGGTVGLAQTGYTTFTNLTTDRTCDANATTVEALADILGTLIVDLKTKGIISA